MNNGGGDLAGLAARGTTGAGSAACLRLLGPFVIPRRGGFAGLAPAAAAAAAASAPSACSFFSASTPPAPAREMSLCGAEPNGGGTNGSDGSGTNGAASGLKARTGGDVGGEGEEERAVPPRGSSVDVGEGIDSEEHKGGGSGERKGLFTAAGFKRKRAGGGGRVNPWTTGRGAARKNGAP